MICLSHIREITASKTNNISLLGWCSPAAFYFLFPKDLYSGYNNYIRKAIKMATTIQVKNQTLERLKFFKESSKESYDEVINKILNEVEEGELTEETIEDIKKGLREIKEGKGESIENVAKEFGIKL
jgi:predicted DNA-binding protein